MSLRQRQDCGDKLRVRTHHSQLWCGTPGRTQAARKHIQTQINEKQRKKLTT